MSTASEPADPDLTVSHSSAAPPPRKPRKIFLLVGVVAAAALAVGLFTSVGSPAKSGPPHAGGSVPSFSAPRLNGSGTVSVPSDGGSGGTPAVLLFFGKWCTICKTELPPIAATVSRQDAASGPLSRVRVLGIDSEDSPSVARSFVQSVGVHFPVATDQDVSITSGAFYFDGDPNAVFVRGNGTISTILRGPISVTQFTAAERTLIPSGS